MTSSAQVERVLAAAGYRPAGRTASGSTLALALDGSDRRVELEVVAVDDVARARLQAARVLRHDHLARVLEVVELDDGHVAVFAEHVVGTTLEHVCGARGPLGPGETVTVAIPVAQALDALHRAGLVHGAVGVRSIVLDPGGRPVLTVSAAALAAGGDPRDDVRTLVAVVVAHLRPDPPDGATAPRHATSSGADGGLREALEDLLRTDREGVPVTADRVVDRCFRTCAPRPVRLPTADELRRVALTAGSVGALRRRPPAEPGRGGAPAPTERRRATRPARAMALLAVAVTVVVAVGIATLGPVGVPAVGGGSPHARSSDAPRSIDAPRSAGSTTVPRLDTPADPDEAAATLTRRRAELLGTGDAARLGEVEVVGGPAHVADSALLSRLAGDRLEGLRAEVAEVTVLPAEASQEARVLVESSASGYARRAADGTVRATGDAASSRVVLVLRWTDAGWRVWDVVAPAD